MRVWGVGGIKAEDVCRLVLPGLRAGVGVREGVVWTALLPAAGTPMMPVGENGALAHNRCLRPSASPPPRRGAGNALHSVSPKTATSGGLVTTASDAGSVTQGPGVPDHRVLPVRWSLRSQALCLLSGGGGGANLLWIITSANHIIVQRY